MNTVFCTIITADYIHYALSLNESLLRSNANIRLNILISDKTISFASVEKVVPNLNFVYSDELCCQGIGKEIYEKYFDNDMDSFRWSMKPVFIKALIEQGHDQVFFLDCDLYFFNSFDFLQEELHGHSIVLTPHWRSSNPEKDKNNFDILQTSGLYNAGFVGVSATGIPAMDWWASACLYKCIKQPEKGLFVDQAYLDLLPIYFEGVKVLRHKGCNVANWNQWECKRTAANTKVLINDKWPIVFIHFTGSTVRGIESGGDRLLAPYLDKQKASLEKYKHWIPDFTDKKRNAPQSIFYPPIVKRRKPSDDFLGPQCKPRKLDIFLIRKAILEAIKTKLPLFNGTLLDVGCGHMPYKALVTSPPSQVIQYIGLDFENNPIHNNNPDITWESGRIPLENNSIDCAIATEVFEHCPDPEAVMKEVVRVLKPGGILFFTVPFLWPLHEVPFDEYRYTPFSLERHLSNSGFKGVKLEALGGWDASLAQMLGLWVRRRRMGRITRTFLSIAAWPLVCVLSKLDKAPASFAESNMITGISGTAVKAE